MNTRGNEALTKITAAALVVLLAAEGITIIQMGGLLSPHMFIGIVLIPPVALKLASTGYRFARYYLGSRPYREKGPPPLVLRLAAPALVIGTIVVLASGIWLLVLGHRSDTVLTVHKVSFIVWGGLFAIHFLWHAPSVLRSAKVDWGRTPGHSPAGAGTRMLLLASALGLGVGVALSLLTLITGWRGS